MDKLAFEQHYGQVYKDMYRFALYTLGKPEDAEDAVSEAVMDAWKGREALKQSEAFKSWIFKILSVKCKRKIKEYIKQREELAPDIPESLADTSGDLEAAVSRGDIQKACTSLEAIDRIILSMTVFGGYTSREIGESLQMKDGTVRSRLSRALDSLEKTLSADWKGECI